MTGPLPHISRMASYTLAPLDVPDGIPVVSMAQNESLRPPSPLALTAAEEAVRNAALYPDPDWTDVRRTLSAVHDIDPQSVLCGAGSLDLIAAIMHAFAGPGRAVLAPQHAYPFFRTAAEMAGARFDLACERDLTVDVHALAQAVQVDTAVVCVANPGNPTGTRIPNGALRDLRNALPRDVLLVIDEAYGEFCDGTDPPLFDLPDAGPTIILRTLSKAYGLAGLRVGWGLFPADIAREIRKVMNPNNISGPTQAAAVAALADQDWMRETCRITATRRRDIIQEMTNHGLTPVPSFTNFVTIKLSGVQDVQHADAALRREGLVLRAQAGAGLPNCLRMTIAAPEHMSQAVRTIASAIRRPHP